jgi:hypothetical protein
VIPPFEKGRSGGIFREYPDNYDTPGASFGSFFWERHPAAMIVAGSHSHRIPVNRA